MFQWWWTVVDQRFIRQSWADGGGELSCYLFIECVVGDKSKDWQILARIIHYLCKYIDVRVASSPSSLCPDHYIPLAGMVLYHWYLERIPSYTLRLCWQFTTHILIRWLHIGAIPWSCHSLRPHLHPLTQRRRLPIPETERDLWEGRTFSTSMGKGTIRTIKRRHRIPWATTGMCSKCASATFSSFLVSSNDLMFLS